MSIIDSNKKEINFKIVYFGPARSGKTTSIEKLNSLIKAQKKSKLIKKKDETEHTLFFDFLALSSESIGGYKTRFQVYTVPGQVLYENSRKLLLKGVDGIIFVVDSQLDKVQEAIKSLEELIGHLQALGYDKDEVPIVIQYNKCDLKGIPPLDELKKVINTHDFPDQPSSALKGEGVVESFRECVRQVMLNLKED